MLQADKVTVRFGPCTIVDNISFSVEEQQWLMIVGPNGAGKSTLLNAVSRGVDYTGRVWALGGDIALDKPAALAKKMGVLMQNHVVGYSFSVEEVVRLGRYAYSKNLFSTLSDEDEQRVEDALAQAGLLEIRGQSVLTLSGGELQRTFLAQLLAQDPSLLILDEPSNHLDLIYQKQVFDLVREWKARPGRAVISVVHDLSLAKAYGSHAMLLDHGKQVAAGPVDRVLTPEHLQEAYGMDVYGWMNRMMGQWKTG